MQSIMRHGKRTLALMLSLIMIFGIIPLTTGAVFADTDGHWAREVIEKWSEYGIVQGDDAGFRPNDPMKRGEFAVVVNRIMAYQTAASNVYHDLDPSEWYTNAVLKLNAAGVMNGVGGGAIDPTGTLTREQAMVMLARIFGVKSNTSAIDTFSDADQVSSWAVGELGGMVAAGYAKGDGVSLTPQADLTRAQAVQLFDNIIKGFYNEAGTYTVDTDGIVVVNTPDVVLTTSKIGSLYVTPGVGSGDFTLRKSTTAKMTVMGGGRNSVVIEDSTVEDLSVAIDSSTGALRVHSAGATTIGSASVAQTSETVTFTGDVGTIEVEAGTTVVVQGNVTDLTIIGENVTVIVEDGASVGNLNVSGDGAAVDVAQGATVTHASIDGNNAQLDVKGTVSDVNVNGDGAKVGVAETGTVEAVTVSANNTSIEGSGKVAAVTITENAGSGNEVKTSDTTVANKSEAPVATNSGELTSGAEGSSGTAPAETGSGGGDSGSSDSNNSGSSNSGGSNNTGGGGIYIPPPPTPAPATIVYDANIADVDALIVMAQEQLAGTYVTELIIEIDKPLGAKLLVDETNFPGDKKVTIKDTQKNVENEHGILLDRDNITLDGLKFVVTDTAKVNAVAPNTDYAVIQVGATGRNADIITGITITGCNISYTATSDNKLIGVSAADGEVTLNSNTISITNSTSGKGAYCVYMRKGALTGNNIFTSSRIAVLLEWYTSFTPSNIAISGDLEINSADTTYGPILLWMADFGIGSSGTFGTATGGYDKLTNTSVKNYINSLFGTVSTGKAIVMYDNTSKYERYYKDANGYIWSQYDNTAWKYCTAAVSGTFDEDGYYKVVSSDSASTLYLDAVAATKVAIENIAPIEAGGKTVATNSAPGNALVDAKTYTVIKATPADTSSITPKYYDKNTSGNTDSNAAPRVPSIIPTGDVTKTVGRIEINVANINDTAHVKTGTKSALAMNINNDGYATGSITWNTVLGTDSRATSTFKWMRYTNEDAGNNYAAGITMQNNGVADTYNKYGVADNPKINTDAGFQSAPGLWNLHSGTSGGTSDLYVSYKNHTRWYVFDGNAGSDAFFYLTIQVIGAT